jgi:5-methyltetrahydropteroyltriglutamate--homocysteine methyltransferase
MSHRAQHEQEKHHGVQQMPKEMRAPRLAHEGDVLTPAPVQHLTLEFTAAGADDLESLGRLREDFELGLGVVDVTPGVPQSPDLIVQRVERALTRVAAARITLNPDCGFAPGSAAKVGIDEVERKLRAEVAAARLLRASR